MKRSILYFGIFLVLLGCNTKAKGQVPDVVNEAFAKKYPGENDPDWKQDDHGYFESHFKKDGVHYRADFNPDGSWVETETSIDKKDLPDVIKERIDKEFSDMEIAEIERVEHHSKGLFYDVEFKQKGKNKDVEFTAEGKILN